MKSTTLKAIENLVPNKSFSIDCNIGYSSLTFDPPFDLPEDRYNSEIARVKAQEPLCILREQRNQLLSSTDWQASSDLTMTVEQTAYRQALRDLPKTATPTLDENGELTGVTWPTEPA